MDFNLPFYSNFYCGTYVLIIIRIIIITVNNQCIAFSFISKNSVGLYSALITDSNQADTECSTDSQQDAG